MAWMISKALMLAYENSRCSQGRGGASLAGSFSDGGRYAQSNGSHTPLAYLPQDRMTAFSRLSRSGTTYKLFEESLGEDLLTWYLEDSRARTCQAPEVNGGLMESDLGYGLKCFGLLARYDLDTCSWKTLQTSLTTDLEESFLDFPRWGMAVGGELWELRRPALHISGKGSGLLPTPMASDNRDRGNVSNPSIQRRIAIGKQVGLSMLFGKEPCPMCVEGMMGWPRGWTDLQPLEMGKTPEQPHWLGQS